MWELWEWNGHYIKGKKLKRSKTKKTVFDYAEKNIKYEKIAEGLPGEWYLENKIGLAVGMIIDNRKKK